VSINVSSKDGPYTRMSVDCIDIPGMMLKKHFKEWESQMVKEG